MSVIKFDDSFRTKTDDYFALSGIREYKKLNHTPFIVFEQGTVKLVDSIVKLLEFPDDIRVIAQWRGQYSSDFFRFSVGQLKDFIKKNPPEDHHQA